MLNSNNSNYQLNKEVKESKFRLNLPIYNKNDLNSFGTNISKQTFFRDQAFKEAYDTSVKTLGKEAAELNKLLKFIKTEKQTGILLIEHDMSVVMGISDHVVVLNYGKKIFEGTADQTKNSKEVIEAYLGVDE